MKVLVFNGCIRLGEVSISDVSGELVVLPTILFGINEKCQTVFKSKQIIAA